jgi:hypothetical protein
MLSQAGVWLLVDPKRPSKPLQADTASWLLPGKLLAHLGIHDDPYFALTELVGPQIAALTAAPGAPPRPQSDEQRQLDKAMAGVDQLRMGGKLEPMLAKALDAAAAMTQVVHATATPPAVEEQPATAH